MERLRIQEREEAEAAGPGAEFVFRSAAQRQATNSSGATSEPEAAPSEPATDSPSTEEVATDHVMPWNRAGPTATRNGQILCGVHNGCAIADQLPDEGAEGP